MTDPIMTLKRVRRLLVQIETQIDWCDLCRPGKMNDHDIIHMLVGIQKIQLSIIAEMLREREAIGEVGRI